MRGDSLIRTRRQGVQRELTADHALESLGQGAIERGRAHDDRTRSLLVTEIFLVIPISKLGKSQLTCRE